MLLLANLAASSVYFVDSCLNRAKIIIFQAVAHTRFAVDENMPHWRHSRDTCRCSQALILLTTVQFITAITALCISITALVRWDTLSITAPPSRAYCYKNKRVPFSTERREQGDHISDRHSSMAVPTIYTNPWPCVKKTTANKLQLFTRERAQLSVLSNMNERQNQLQYLPQLSSSLPSVHSWSPSQRW